MEIIRLPIGETPPLDADCLRIEEQPGGAFNLAGSAMCMRQDEADSVSIVGGPAFASREAAEQAGVAWAEDVGVERLFVGTGTLGKPIALTEVDLPLETPSSQDEPSPRT